MGFFDDIADIALSYRIDKLRERLDKLDETINLIKQENQLLYEKLLLEINDLIKKEHDTFSPKIEPVSSYDSEYNTDPQLI